MQVCVYICWELGKSFTISNTENKKQKKQWRMTNNRQTKTVICGCNK